MLSARDKELLALLAEGLTNEQIGERMFISGNTVKTHLAKIGKKVGTTSRVRLSVEALRNGWIDYP